MTQTFAMLLHVWCTSRHTFSHSFLPLCEVGERGYHDGKIVNPCSNTMACHFPAKQPGDRCIDTSKLMVKTTLLFPKQKNIFSNQNYPNTSGLNPLIPQKKVPSSGWGAVGMDSLLLHVQLPLRGFLLWTGGHSTGLAGMGPGKGHQLDIQHLVSLFWTTVQIF